MTFDINEYWGVTFSHADLIGRNQWRAKAWVFRRDDFRKIGHPHIGNGATRNLADEHALAEARQSIFTLGTPEKWKQ